LALRAGNKRWATFVVSVVWGLREDGVIPRRHDVRVIGPRKEVFQGLQRGQFSIEKKKGETETYVEPDVVSFFCRRRDFHLPLRRRDNNTILIETRRHGIRVKHRAYAFNIS
jgi:hypothetical protein